MKTTDIAILALVGVGGYFLYKELTKPPVPLPPNMPSNTLPSGSSAEKWQIAIAAFQAALAAGMSIYDAVQASRNAAGASVTGSWYNLNTYRNVGDKLCAENNYTVI